MPQRRSRYIAQRLRSEITQVVGKREENLRHMDSQRGRGMA